MEQFYQWTLSIKGTVIIESTLFDSLDEMRLTRNDANFYIRKGDIREWVITYNGKEFVSKKEV